MKKKHILLSLLLCATAFESASAQGWVIYRSDGTKVVYPHTAVDSIVAYTGQAPNPDGEPTEGLAIDLGLPSGTRWASHNVGATKPEDYGDHYAWGETVTKDNYKEGTYLYYDSQSTSYIDIGEDIAGTEYDVAHMVWGGTWRMPTEKQIKELLDSCTWTWSSRNGVNGYKVEGTNGNSIFLPAAGFCNEVKINVVGSMAYYWTSTRDADSRKAGYSLDFDSDGMDRRNGFRYYGFSVRPVTE